MFLKGSYTALITPFKGENAEKVDFDIFQKLVERQISSGTHGLVPCGTTGESPTLSYSEHNEVIEKCVSVAKGKAVVLAGTGSNNTLEAIELTQHAEKSGADAALIMTPYYNKPTQEGIFRHFEAIHNATSIPLVIYNIPGRSVVDIKDETIARIAELKRVIGVKDATGDLNRPLSLQKLIKKTNFYQLSGEDETAVEFNRRGGVGVISVASNIAPKTIAKVQNLCLEGKFEEAEALDKKIINLHKLCFCEVSPQPVKYLSEVLRLCSGKLRLPLIEVSNENKVKLQKLIEEIKDLEI
jgi:4-hydroxy-tetrahydrodipicolinate synthase